MQYTDVCRIAQLPNRGWLLGFGREVFFPRHKCSVERTENLMGSILLGYIYLYILLLHYIAICLYIYIDILLFFYCLIACLKHGSIAFFISIVLIRYSIFRNGPFFRLLIITGITVVAVFLSFIEPSSAPVHDILVASSGLCSFLPISLMNVSAKSYLYILSFFRSWWQRIVS